jgi:uncharacterized hydrophobic protein (TIGR00341 family)
MSLRLIEIRAKEDQEKKIREVLEEHKVEGVHCLPLEKEVLLIRGVLLSEEAEPIFDALDPDKYSGIHQIFISNVEAVIPKIEREEEEEKEEAAPAPEEEKNQIKLGRFVRISKEELRNDVQGSSKLTLNFILLFILSSIVAGIGILKENTAIVIGAMVIAPFLGPNVALAFGTTVGDLKMVRSSLRTAVIGTIIAFGISVVWGVVDTGVRDIQHDIFIEYRDIALALTCGFAGVLSMMMGQATSLVGVMVAAALLPPLMRAGLFLGGQLWVPALNSFLIYMANIICVNIAGILTFYLAGIRPKFWWEEKTARKHRVRALLIWSTMLVLLAGTIFLIRRLGLSEMLQ